MLKTKEYDNSIEMERQLDNSQIGKIQDESELQNSFSISHNISEEINEQNVSSSHQVYIERKKKKRKTPTNLNNNKIIINNKITMQEEENSAYQNKNHPKVPKQNERLEYFFHKQIIIQKPKAVTYKTQQDQLSVDYINNCVLKDYTAGYSLQPYFEQVIKQQKNSQKQLRIDKWGIKQKQLTKAEIKSDDQSNKSSKKIIYRSKASILKILGQLRKWYRIDIFFLKPYRQIQYFAGMNRYYEYNDLIKTQIIRNPRDLQTIQEDLNLGKIDNFTHFCLIFDQLVTNSIIIHTHIYDPRMLQLTYELDLYFKELIIKQIFSNADLTYKGDIKTKLMPTNKMTDNQVQFLDMNNLKNIKRVQIMNQFLRKICQKDSKNCHQIMTKVKNLLSQCPNNKVNIQQALYKDKFYCKIDVKQIQLDSFERLKIYIKLIINEQNRLEQFYLNRTSNNQPAPNADSSDFSLESDSN